MNVIDQYRNEFDVGLAAEDRFDGLALIHGMASARVSTSDNIMKHVDRRIVIGTTSYGVDVKAMKMCQRGGEVDEAALWLEFKGITGHDGWMKGSANFLAFEVSNGFMLVGRAMLLRWCRKVVKNEMVSTPEDALYKLYQRDGREDLMTKVLVDDVKKEVSHMMMLEVTK